MRNAQPDRTSRATSDFDDFDEWPESDFDVDDEEFARAIEAGRQLEPAA